MKGNDCKHTVDAWRIAYHDRCMINSASTSNLLSGIIFALVFHAIFDLLVITKTKETRTRSNEERVEWRVKVAVPISCQKNQQDDVQRRQHNVRRHLSPARHFHQTRRKI